MQSTEQTLEALRREMQPLLQTAMEGVLTKVRGVLEEAEQQRTQDLAEVTEERAKGLAEVAKEREKGVAEVDARRAELHHEVASMQMHQAAHEGRVELNIGGFRFETSVQTLRRVPHTFFDAYFSGRYAQDVCADGSIFVDRDGKHFGHVLEYMRDGVVSVAEPGVHPSISLLRALKREFGFYCIELCAEQPMEPDQSEVALVMGGYEDSTLASMEQYELSSDQWSVRAAMNTARSLFGACTLAGELYVTGGLGTDEVSLSSVEKYTPSSDTWTTVAPLPSARCDHAAVTVGSVMYVLGGGIGLGDEANLASTLMFDSTENTWSAVNPMPEARRGHSACAIGSDIYVFGGRYQTSVFKLDTETNTWSTLEPMPFPSSNYSCSVLDGDQVYIVAAGFDGKDVLRLDTASGVWSILAATLDDKQGSATFVVGGYLYVAGGESNPSSVERYDVVTDTWAAVADMLEGRVYIGAVTIRSMVPAEDQDLFDSIIAKAGGEPSELSQVPPSSTYDLNRLQDYYTDLQIIL
jgi:N-acetylneuraminic acid mutarotase